MPIILQLPLHNYPARCGLPLIPLKSEVNKVLYSHAIKRKLKQIRSRRKQTKRWNQFNYTTENNYELIREKNMNSCFSAFINL